MTKRVKILIEESKMLHERIDRLEKAVFTSSLMCFCDFNDPMPEKSLKILNAILAYLGLKATSTNGWEVVKNPDAAPTPPERVVLVKKAKAGK